MPPTLKTLPTFKKAQKCKYLPAGLRKIIEVKNKKMQNYVSQKHLIKTPTPTRDVILEKKLKIIFSRHKVALES